MRAQTWTVLAVPRCASKVLKTGDLRYHTRRRQCRSRPADTDSTHTGYTETENGKAQKDRHPCRFWYGRDVGFALNENDAAMSADPTSEHWPAASSVWLTASSSTAVRTLSGLERSCSSPCKSRPIQLAKVQSTDPVAKYRRSFCYNYLFLRSGNLLSRPTYLLQFPLFCLSPLQSHAH